jgi:hypothetical protein
MCIGLYRYLFRSEENKQSRTRTHHDGQLSSLHRTTTRPSPRSCRVMFATRRVTFATRRVTFATRRVTFATRRRNPALRRQSSVSICTTRTADLRLVTRTRFESVVN